ncbi:MAG: FAD/NAD(P)-binding protein [Gammaproteobacteria bacterium]|nr:FAD/NAD(P)-binding protein [Gammaproteobacteria bacterium]
MPGEALISPWLPHNARILSRVQEAPDIFTWQLQFTEPAVAAAYRFEPGQFNMLCLPGVGEVPISIASDPDEPERLSHTIRVVGRVTEAMARLPVGACVGLRGPYGTAWPLAEAAGGDVLVVTGGLGCAPVLGVIHYVLRRREAFGRLILVQGVKHANDLIWRERYAEWATQPNVQVLMAADHGGPLWPWHVGRVTEVFDQIQLNPARTQVMMCGPEGMMLAAVQALDRFALDTRRIWLSLERNMHCAVGHCGHCQFGADFICRQGPVFALPAVRSLLGVRGF